jgi:hypothetical protein
MSFLHLFIVNKSGGLIHHRPLSSKAPTLSTNEWLRIGSTFHSLYAIAAEANPVTQQGIDVIETGSIQLECLQTRTGLKFVVTAEQGCTHASILQDVYVLYAHCVLKDPFYELDMPIRSELFVQAVDALIERVSSNSSGTSGTGNISKR